MTGSPIHIDVRKTEGLTIHWSETEVSFYPVAYLRRHSPSADNRILQVEMQENPLAVLPTGYATDAQRLQIADAQFVGRYAIRITFSDGHNTGLYSWTYLREIDPSHCPGLRNHAVQGHSDQQEESP
jgi:DUF971 family protein